MVQAWEPGVDTRRILLARILRLAGWKHGQEWKTSKTSRKPQSFSEAEEVFRDILLDIVRGNQQVIFRKQGATSMKSKNVENFFGETLKFSKFSPASRRKIQQGVSTPGSHGSSLRMRLRMMMLAN
jgi:hypothetical protein